MPPLRRIILFIITAASCAVPPVGAAQDRYHTSILEKMARCAGIDSACDTLPDGVHRGVLSFGGKEVTVIAEGGKVTHIGHSLFPEDLLCGERAAPLRFLERYALLAHLPEASGKSPAMMCRTDEVFFSKGDLPHLRDMTWSGERGFTIGERGGRSLYAKWETGGDTECEMEFPLDYQLLSGMDIAEAEKRLAEELLRNAASEQPEVTPAPAAAPSDNGEGIYVEKGDSCYLASLNDNRFYSISSSGEARLIHSAEFPEESLANILTSDSIRTGMMAKIKLVMYDFNRLTLEIPLSSMLGYFRKKGCRNYFGIIEKGKDRIEAELLVVNRSEGYCHTIRLNCGVADIGSGGGTVEGRMNSFIPVSRIRQLFKPE